MGKETKEIVADRVRWIFGDVADQILQLEEATLKAQVGKNLSPEHVEKIATDLRDLAQRMAGPWIADRVYLEVVEVLSPNRKVTR